MVCIQLASALDTLKTVDLISVFDINMLRRCKGGGGSSTCHSYEQMEVTSSRSLTAIEGMFSGGASTSFS